MKHPRHLWSGAWRQESEEARRAFDEQGEPLTAVTEIQERTQPAGAQPTPTHPTANGTHTRPARETAPEQERRRGVGRRAALLAVPAAAVAIGGYALGVRTSDDSARTGSQAAETLPAASSSTPLQPRAGTTRTGAIYAKASPAVVSIRTGSGSGTGFLVRDTTTVVTNAHVVDGSTNVTVRFGARGRQIDGRVMGIDPSSDLAVVRIPGGSAPSDAKPLQLADSTKVGVGDPVVAIGNPFGLDRTATEGIVSGLGREIQAPNGFSIEDAIQTDAPINPGNSGGPLLDQSAHVVGVNSQIETGGASNGNVGIGFAVPSNTVREAVPILAAGRKVAHAWLGIESGATNAVGTGAIVRQATAGGPADRAGLGPGDQILSIDGEQVAQVSDVARIVNEKRPGDRVRIEIRRGSRRQTVTVTLGTRPQQIP